MSRQKSKIKGVESDRYNNIKRSRIFFLKSIRVNNFKISKGVESDIDNNMKRSQKWKSIRVNNFKNSKGVESDRYNKNKRSRKGVEKESKI